MAHNRVTDYVSAAKLRELTGFAHKGKQIGWLRDNHWLFEVNRFGRPRVDQAYYDRRMVGTGAPAKPQRSTAGPNWAALGG